MKNRTFRYWIEADYVIVEERETFDKYHKGFKRRWHTSRVSFSLEEFREMIAELSETAFPGNKLELHRKVQEMTA